MPTPASPTSAASARAAVLAPLAIREKVPYIATWSEERMASPGLVVRGTRAGTDRLGYRNERKGDRDLNGVLWRRFNSKPGWGKPKYATMHPDRQRRAVGGALCSSCGKPTAGEETAAGLLYLLSRRGYEMDPEGPIISSEPPIHVACAQLAVKHCPHLRDYVPLRAKTRRPCGVYGQVVIADSTGRVFRDAGFQVVTPDDWRIRWVIAQNAMQSLENHTVVDLHDEALRLAV